MNNTDKLSLFRSGNSPSRGFSDISHDSPPEGDSNDSVVRLPMVLQLSKDTVSNLSNIGGGGTTAPQTPFSTLFNRSRCTAAGNWVCNAGPSGRPGDDSADDRRPCRDDQH